MCVKNNLRSCHFIFATCSRRFVAERKPVNFINFTSFFVHTFQKLVRLIFASARVVLRLTGRICAIRKLKQANRERQSILVELNALLITFVGILYIIVLCHTRRGWSSQGRVWKLTTHSCRLFDKKTLAIVSWEGEMSLISIKMWITRQATCVCIKCSKQATFDINFSESDRMNNN